MRLSRALLGALLALALAPAAASAQAEDTIYENLSIPTVDGDRIHVEVARPKGVAKAPVILTYSPYNSLGEVPGHCAYFDEASQNPFKGSVVYGWGTLIESFKVFLHRAGLRAPRARTS